MPSIDEILNGLGVEGGTEKTASKTSAESEVEAQAKNLGLIPDTASTKTASTNQNSNGGKMNLNDYYNDVFGESTKTAEAESEEEKKKEEEGKDDEEKNASALEAAGEQAGRVFSEELQNRIVGFAVKLAMDGLPDSSATQDNQAGSTVVPGKNENPQLPVNRREDADKAMDTTPEYYDLEGMSGAVAKARIESALASGDIGELSHKSHNVDTGLETPDSQKTASMKLTDLTREQLVLLQTEFPAEMMKEAQAQVAAENEKLAEVDGIAGSCYEYGAELAMQKIAEMEASAKDKKEDEKEEEKEEEKNASAMGRFIVEGYWNTMMEKGAEYYKDPNIYLEELVKEAKLEGVMKTLSGYASKASKAAKSLPAKASQAAGAASAGAKKGLQAVKKDATKAYGHAKSTVTGKTVAGGKTVKADRKKEFGKFFRTGAGKSLALGGAAGAGFAGGRSSK